MQTYLLLCILCSTEFLSLGGRDSLDLLVLYKHIKRCADNDFQYIVFLMSKKLSSSFTLVAADGCATCSKNCYCVAATLDTSDLQLRAAGP